MNYKRITDIADIINGFAFKSKNYASEGIRIIRIANVQDGFISDESPCFYPFESKTEIQKYLLENDDLLISLTGNVGRVGIINGTFLPATLNQRVACIRIHDEGISKKYLFYYLRRRSFMEDCVNASKGVAQLNLSTKWLEQYLIPLPEFPEQERIVARIEELFSELDKAVETLQTTKKQLAAYRQAVLKEAFSGLAEKKTIRDKSCLVTSGSRGWAQYYSSQGAKFIRIGNLTRTGININLSDIQYVSLPNDAEGKRTHLEPNDVLISITADLGSIGLVPQNIDEAYVNQHIAMVRFKSPQQGRFMAWYLRSEDGQKDLLKNKRGGGKLGLGLDDIRDSRVPDIPDELAFSIVEQIESRLSVCDSIEKTVDTALAQSEAMRQSILKKAFEGRLV